MTSLVTLRSVRADWLRVQGEVAWVGMLLAGQRYFDALRREQHFNPNHDNLGRFTTGDGAAGGSNTGGQPKTGGDHGLVHLANSRGRASIAVRVGRSSLEMTPIQAGQYAGAVAWRNMRLQDVQQVDPNWKAPRSIYEGVDGLIAATEGDALAAEGRLRELDRLTIGGNGGPPLDFSSPRPGTGFGPFTYSQTYRAVTGMPELPGYEAFSREDGTVALSDLRGKLVFGVNSDASAYTDGDRADANALRDVLIEKYPEDMATGNIGHKPNDALYHAETNLLLRAAKQNGGSLAGQTFEVHVDRKLCESCKVVLPLASSEIGSPTVKFIEPSGKINFLRNGQWQK